jgi:hypothetical protein
MSISGPPLKKELLCKAPKQKVLFRSHACPTRTTFYREFKSVLRAPGLRLYKKAPKKREGGAWHFLMRLLIYLRIEDLCANAPMRLCERSVLCRLYLYMPLCHVLGRCLYMYMFLQTHL